MGDRGLPFLNSFKMRHERKWNVHAVLFRLSSRVNIMHRFIPEFQCLHRICLSCTNVGTKVVLTIGKLRPAYSALSLNILLPRCLTSYTIFVDAPTSLELGKTTFMQFLSATLEKKRNSYLYRKYLTGANLISNTTLQHRGSFLNMPLIL